MTINPPFILCSWGNTRIGLRISDIHTQKGLAFTKEEIEKIQQSGTKIDAILNAGDMTFISHTGETEDDETESKVQMFKTALSSKNLDYSEK